MDKHRPFYLSRNSRNTNGLFQMKIYKYMYLRYVIEYDRHS